MSRILVVDDESSIIDFLRLLLEDEGYEVAAATSMQEGSKAFGEGSYDLVLCDIMMPDGNGLDLLREIKERDSSASVIMMTAYASTTTAIEAMKSGAYDYVSKPFDVEELKVVIQKALEKAELVDENVYLRRELREKYRFSNIIGRSRKMQEIFALIDIVVGTDGRQGTHNQQGKHGQDYTRHLFLRRMFVLFETL